MKLLCFLTFIFFTLSISAQEDKYDEMIILFADAKYEKLLSLSEKFAKKEENRKDPEAYIWSSKAYYKISLSGTMDPAYKNAYKSSVKALEKAKKLDKDSSCFKRNEEYVEELELSLKEMIVNELDVRDLKKAAGWAQLYSKISYNSIGSDFLVAACKYRGGDKTGAKTIQKKCEESLLVLNSIDNWSDADKTMLKAGVLEYSECYLAAKQLDKAMELLNTIQPWFSKDEDFIEKYKEFSN